MYFEIVGVGIGVDAHFICSESEFFQFQNNVFLINIRVSVKSRRWGIRTVELLASFIEMGNLLNI